jgi:preprotein translocase subunit SecA
MPQNYGALERVLRVGEGRRVKKLADQAAYITSLEPDFEALSDEELAGKTVEFRQRLENGEDLDELVFEAYAAVREAAKRAIGLRPFDVQLMGAMVLHEGDIAEMKTGEGKTLVATMPLYLNALAADVIYGTHSEFGFDYLRDNMATSLEGTVQRSHAYAIVDEVDSILIDEARTPLIISGEPETAAKTYYDFARVVRGLTGVPAKFVPKGVEKPEDDADYEYDEKFKTVSPRESAIETVERALGIENLYAPQNAQLVNHLVQALKAESLYQRDVDYVIQDGEVKIVDEFTGRIMEGRRWSEGLHQAVEAKEGVAIKEEHVTLATITLQNYFRLYEKLAGMTGTAKTEEKEFQEIYDLSVVEIPTNVAVAREDEDDLIYKTKEAKYNAVTEDIKERHEEGQPILVGTISVEVSEHLSQLLTRQGIPHNVLNAKQHEREAEIIKDAGEPGAVTIATNMAGRGVDIKLGEGVRELGGLYVLGTERHEARRIDNQLRGRSGRQGDPGESRFYLSAQDDLVRLFAGDRIERIMNRFKLPDDEPMEQKILSNQIENAQKKVEEQNFVSRKNVLKYDDVMNVQRMVIYEQRRRVLEGDDLSEDIGGWIDELIERIVVEHTSSEYQEEWDLDSLFKEMADIYELQVQPDELDSSMTQDELVAEFQDDARDAYEAKEEELGSELMREIERFLILQVVDTRWREHLDAMEYLRDGIHLRAMAQKDPLVEYRSEGHAMFEELGQIIREEVVRYLFHVEIERDEAQQLSPAASPNADSLSYEHDSLAGSDAIAAAGGNGGGSGRGGGVTAGAVGGGAMSVATGQRTVPEQQKVGRNDPCWCGSGKKFKKCHGA